ncbi:short-chain dehydrogenase [Heyndrickxia sp. NPDC080065]|uniref:short-chain dehydrogenase n=1 Tax=Heyndrickxia sp. NPDC080065 TaxID=3390568 RepID=UPI003D063A66
MKHALVVGGTGMLAGVSLWLVNQGYQVSVIGRNPNRMESLAGKTEDKNAITPVLVDYSNEVLLKENVRSIIKENGPIQLVIAWIHSYAERSIDIILQEVSKQNDKWRLYHVLGSSKNLNEIKKKISTPDTCLYRQIQLGFILENDNSRWLTNEEISQGVIDSIQNDRLIYTVGTIEPWGKRP